MKHRIFDGGITSPKGFKASGVEAGIKYKNKKDVALICSETDCSAAGVFTTNKVAAAPVVLDRQRIASGKARAVLVNSGCANACTGEKGLVDAQAMARAAADALCISEELVLIGSTGVIGVNLPMDRISHGAKLAVSALSAKGGADAARAIMTTDTVPKEIACDLTIDGRTVTLGGMCKGSGMIEPNMATMLGYITTDAAIGPADLQAALRDAVEISFNRVVVDGDQSTNDTVLVLANGAAGNVPLSPAHPQWADFTAALREICVELSKKIVLDGEGATKFVSVKVRGAKTNADAQLAARAIAKSPLVKTSWFGIDPNWGRVIAAAGYSGADVDDQKARIYYGDICAYDRGKVAGKETLEQMQQIMKARAFDVTVDLGLGDGTDTIFTCDFSFDYVKINAEYTT